MAVLNLVKVKDLFLNYIIIQFYLYQVSMTAVEKLKELLPAEAGLEGVNELHIHCIDEGKEPHIFFEGLLSAKYTTLCIILW